MPVAVAEFFQKTEKFRLKVHKIMSFNSFNGFQQGKAGEKIKFSTFRMLKRLKSVYYVGILHTVNQEKI